MQDPKKSPKIAIWAPSFNFVGLYLRNYGMYRQLEKKLFKQQYLLYMSHNMVNFGPLVAEIVSLVWGTPGNFNGFRVLAALLHGTTPLPSNRHHRSCGDCLEGKGENYQVCSVQYCVQQLCTVRCTHI